MEIKEKCRVHYCTNKREFGKNGQLMNYCGHCKKLNLLNKTGTWENPHIIFKNDIIFLTLPTPKQEQIAIELAKKNNHYKIICIGASISIASGQEKTVPRYLENFEFLWRLRTEPVRRINRLFVSLYYFLKGKYFQKKLDYLNIYSVD